MKNNLFWDGENKSIRGSFVNFILTLSLLSVLLFAILSNNKEMVESINKLSSLIIWFFGLSFGIWSGKKTIETVYKSSDKTDVTTKING